VHVALPVPVLLREHRSDVEHPDANIDGAEPASFHADPGRVVRLHRQATGGAFRELDEMGSVLRRFLQRQLDKSQVTLVQEHRKRVDCAGDALIQVLALG
jgi:hypothetical protein